MRLEIWMPVILFRFPLHSKTALPGHAVRAIMAGVIRRSRRVCR